MNQPKSLKELVELAVQHRGASGLGLSQLATKNGLKLTATTINAIRQGTYKYTPKDETIRAIAWLAGVSDEVAFTAAGQPVPGPPFAEELPPGVDNLPPKARKAAIDMLRVLVDMNKDDEDASNHSTQLPPAERVVNPRTGEYFRRGSTGERFERERIAAEDNGARDSGTEQKTEEQDDDIAAVKRRTAENIEIIKARQRGGADNNIPLPDDYLDLAADTSQSRHVDREREWAERGEVSQETE